jgi:chromosome segregation ATPase
MLHDSPEDDSLDRESLKPRPASRMHVVWYAAVVLSLAANAYLIFMTHDLSTDAANSRDALTAQIAAVDQKVGAASREAQQRMESLSSEARQEAAAALDQARTEDRKSSARMTSALQQHQVAEQQQVASAVNDLKNTTATAASKLDQVSGDVDNVKGDVSNVKADVATARSELEGTGTELKRVNGDMGVMSGLIATNARELAELRQLGERNYFEFDMKTGAPQKVGDIRLTLRKTDPKKNKFTLDISADDKTTEKRDRTIDEPIQFYVAGRRQPYELVINTVNKGEVTGYLATPRTTMASR